MIINNNIINANIIIIIIIRTQIAWIKLSVQKPESINQSINQSQPKTQFQSEFLTRITL